MVENIGKCECIFPYEKHYISVSLQNEIDKTTKEIERLRNVKQDEASEYVRQMALDSADLLEKTYLSDIKTVFERISAMKEC